MRARTRACLRLGTLSNCLQSIHNVICDVVFCTVIEILHCKYLIANKARYCKRFSRMLKQITKKDECLRFLTTLQYC